MATSGSADCIPGDQLYIIAVKWFMAAFGDRVPDIPTTARKSVVLTSMALPIGNANASQSLANLREADHRGTNVKERDIGRPICNRSDDHRDG